MMSPASALAAAENAVCYFDDDHQYETASEHSGDDEPRLPFSARLAAATTAAIANDMNGGDRAAPCLVTDLGRIAGARWSEMDAEAKAPREAEAREHKERYEAERRAHQDKHAAAAAAAAATGGSHPPSTTVAVAAAAAAALPSASDPPVPAVQRGVPEVGGQARGQPQGRKRPAVDDPYGQTYAEQLAAVRAAHRARFEAQRGAASRAAGASSRRAGLSSGHMCVCVYRPGLESSLGLGGGRVGSGGGPFCRWGQVRRRERGQGAVPGFRPAWPSPRVCRPPAAPERLLQ